MKWFLERDWIFFPILSAIFILLTFYPTRFLALGFIALVPFFYFLHTHNDQNTYRLFWSGALFGIITALSIAYVTFIQFHWLPETYLFTKIVHLLFIPVTLISSLVWGFIASLYRSIRTEDIITDTILLAFLWVLVEKFFTLILGNYNLAMLAYAASTIPELVRLAALGGMIFVSFILALLNSFLATILVIGIRKNWGDIKKLALFFLGIIFFLSGATLLQENYISSGAREEKRISVSLIQNQDRASGSFGVFTKGKFSFPNLEKWIREANTENPDIIIYPFTPYIGALREDSKAAVSFNTNVIAGTVSEFILWTQKHIPRYTTFVTWNTIFRGEIFSNEFNFWRDGTLNERYQKRALFPFLDYTPIWVQQFGFYTTPFDITPGSSDQKKLHAGDHSLSPLICSEIHDVRLVDKNADMLLSLGSDAMFYGDVLAYIDFVIAQYRAAEYYKPVIRGNRFGPSGIINSHGRVLASMDSNQEGVLSYNVTYIPTSRRTLYARIGEWPLWIIGLLFLVYVLIRRHFI